MKSMIITPPAGYEIDREKSTFDEIIFKEVKCKYPIELSHMTPDLNIQLILFGRLVQTCREWNKIDGFENKCGISKVCLLNINNNVRSAALEETGKPIAFKDHKTAELFIKTFRTELEQVKELL